MFLHHLQITPRQRFRCWLTIDWEDTHFLIIVHTSEIPEANKLGSWSFFDLLKMCHDIGEERPCVWLINITNTTGVDVFQVFLGQPSSPNLQRTTKSKSHLPGSMQLPPKGSPCGRRGETYWKTPLVPICVCWKETCQTSRVFHLKVRQSSA